MEQKKIIHTTTPGPLYNMVHYNTVWDITVITDGPKLNCFAICPHILLSNNTDWIANTEIGLYPSNSVIKRLMCIINSLSKKYEPHHENELRHEKINYAKTKA